MIGAIRWVGAAMAPAMTIRPPANISQPPTRCVRSQTRSLESVHGVRMPNDQFERVLGITLPMIAKSAPTPNGITRTTGMSAPSVTARVMKCTPSMNVRTRLIVNQYVGSNLA